jgi:heme-degrading monooxygenase HmoA
MVSVADMLILARVQLNELDYLTVEDYATQARDRLSGVDGFVGMSVWQRNDDPMAILIAYQYGSLEAAERGLLCLTGIRLLAEQQSADYRPADVQRVHVHRQDGTRLHDTPAGAYLSVSSRVADPGYGKDLDEEIERIFDELRLLPGFLGSLHGPNDVLAEEIVALALWRSIEAFQASIPPSARNYEVRLLRRLV